MTSLLASRPRVDRSFERLYRRHVTDVYHFSLAVLRNPADAEDVTQTTFLNAYNAFRRGERPSAPRNWLIAIAHNVCRQRFRQSARRPQEVAFDQDLGETLVEDDGPSAHDIRKALGHLAFNQRAALVMRELEGRSYAEIAEILGLTVSAVETLIFRARRALREQLEGSLTCQDAELAISKQVDGRLPRAEKGALRAHLRECRECASFARSQRAQRAALRSIAAIPLPSSLASFFGGGGAAAGAGVAAKAATVVAVGALVGGVGYEGAKRLPIPSGKAGAAESAPAVAAAAAKAAPARPTGGTAGVVGPVAPGARSVAAETLGAARGKGRAKDRAGAGGNRAATTPGRSAQAPGHTKVQTSAGRGSSRANPRGRADDVRTKPVKKPKRPKKPKRSAPANANPPGQQPVRKPPVSPPPVAP